MVFSILAGMIDLFNEMHLRNYQISTCHYNCAIFSCQLFTTQGCKLLTQSSDKLLWAAYIFPIREQMCTENLNSGFIMADSSSGWPQYRKEH